MMINYRYKKYIYSDSIICYDFPLFSICAYLIGMIFYDMPIL